MLKKKRLMRACALTGGGSAKLPGGPGCGAIAAFADREKKWVGWRCGAVAGMWGWAMGGTG